MIKLLLALIAATLLSCDKQETAYGEIEVIPSDMEVHYIYSLDDLLEFRTLVNGGATETNGALRANIDLGGAKWTPIGGNTTTDAYSGTFFGGGYMISNFTIDNSTSANGLFSTIYNATIMNLTANYANISTGAYSGIICGQALNSSITNCHVKNSSLTSSVNDIGAIAGITSNTTITKCSNSSPVSGKKNIGGIVGYATNGEISSCSNSGNITATESSVGGIVGNYDGTTLSGNTNTGTISGDN